jgi:glucan 1,3-beta-glucosidase
MERQPTLIVDALIVDAPGEDAAGATPVVTTRTRSNRPDLLGMMFRLMMIVWAFGVAVFGLRLVISWWVSVAKSRKTSLPSDQQQSRFDRLAPRLTQSGVHVRIADQPSQMPICTGFWKSNIILPLESDDWNDDQLKSVLNHELAHAVRGDAWVHLVAQVQRSVLWFHPFAAIANNRLRQECELACDDWAIQQGVSEHDYAKTLLNVASRFRTGRFNLCQPMAARSSSLDSRIQSIMRKSGRRDPMSAGQKSAWLVGFVLIVGLVSSIWVDVTEAEQFPSSDRAVTGSENDSVPMATSDENSRSPATNIAAVTVSSSKQVKAKIDLDHGGVVKAVNLGNWLLLEPWLLDITDDAFPDQSSILKLLKTRFGEAKTEQLLAAYRQNWITRSDLQAARNLGFNAVRLPFDCGLLEDPNRPGSLRKDAFRWLDHAVGLCEQVGLAVILDLHGAPGGQSLDGPSGDASSNLLWTDATARDRTVLLWQKIASHYAGNPTVIAYDVINEPFGDFDQDLRESMLDLFSRLYVAIRKADLDTLIYAPATLDGFAFYGNPAEKGWKHVGFTQHAYPGLFDGRPVAVRSHDMFLKHWVEPVDRLVDELDVPFLLGEYNVVFEDAGGAALTAWYAQEYERREWSTAIWTLKRLLRDPSPDVNSWSLLTNSVGVNMDLRNDSYEDLVAAIKQIGQMSWHSDPKFSKALNGKSQPWQWPGRDPWQSLEVETDVAGSSIIRGQHWILQAAGRDIFRKRDRFHFRCRPAEDDFQATARVLWIDETSPWAKAGWMIRADESADAAHLMVHTTPDGKVMICGRDARGEDSWQEVVGVGGLPVHLGIKRQGNRVLIAWTDAGGHSKKKVFTPAFLSNAKSPLVGMAVCSLAPGIRTSVGLDQVAFKSFRSDGSAANFDAWQTKPTNLVSAPVDSTSESATAHGSVAGANDGWKPVAVANASFEEKGESDDLALGWNRWGDWINRETGWAPVHQGGAIIGYHHYRIESDSDSGLWQNVKVQPNQHTKFRIHGNADVDGNASFAKSVELRMEVPGKDGTPVSIASKTFDARKLATGDKWSTLEVSARPESSVVRLIVRVTPASGDKQRGGSLKFDSAEVLQQASNNAATGTASPTSSAKASTPKTGSASVLQNGSFEQRTEDAITGWSQWGGWFGRQDGWTPVRDGQAILAYEHYRVSGSDNSGVWQDIETSTGTSVKFTVHANVDRGQSGNRMPKQVELKLESPLPDGKTVTLAKKTFEASHLADGDKWSLLSVEGTALSEKVRCLIIVEPSDEEEQRDGALKFDQASVELLVK